MSLNAPFMNIQTDETIPNATKLSVWILRTRGFYFTV